MRRVLPASLARVGGVVAALLLALIPAAPAGAQGIVWTGPAGGEWSDPNNWNPAIVPNNDPPNAYRSASIVSAGPTVNAAFSIAGMSNQDVVTVPLGGQLSFASAGDTTINNSGTISIAPGSTNFSSAIVFAGNATQTVSHTLNGNGTILLTGVGTARLLGNTNGALINNGNTIFGEGHFIEGFMSFTNNGGSVTASGGTLLFNPGGCTNQGVLGAVAGGTLVINGGGGTVNNAGGSIFADQGRVQLFNNARITGGVLTTSGDGLIESVFGGNSTVTLTDVTNNGTLSIAGTGAALHGTTTNNRLITLRPGRIMTANNTATLTGSGTLVLTTTSLFLAGEGTTPTLVNVSNIVGSGLLGGALTSLKIVNQGAGRIRATGGTLTINAYNANLTNNGIMEASAGTLELDGNSGFGFHQEGAGEIRADTDSLVVFRGSADVRNGKLSTAGTGTMLVLEGRFRDLTLDAEVRVSGTLAAAGLIQGSGTITAVAGSQLKIGSCRIGSRIYSHYQSSVIGVPGGSFSDGGEGGADPLLINDGIIEGAGSFGGNTLAITNNGEIRGNAGSVGSEQPLWINPSADGFTNHGTVEATDSGVVVFDGAGGGAFAQQGGGIVRAATAGSNVRLLNGASLAGGVLGAGAGSVSLIGPVTLQSLVSEANLLQIGVSTLTLAGSITNNGTITTPTLSRLFVNGTVSLDSGGAGRLVNNGSIVVSTGGRLDAGAIDGTGRSTAQTGATLIAHSIRQGVLRIDDAGAAQLKPFSPANADPTRVGSLSIGAAGAFLDVSNRALIHDYSGGSPLPALRANLASGYNAGAWDGPGINSSTAAAYPQLATAVGAIEASGYIAATGSNVFAGQTVDSTTVLLRYTWYGDSDLGGVVDFDDYVRLDTGFNGNLSGWFNGDFDFNNAIDFDDYVLIDLGFNVQDGTLARAQAYLSGDDRRLHGMYAPPLRKVVEHFERFGVDYATHFLSAVPEPGIGAACAALGAMANRSRRMSRATATRRHTLASPRRPMARTAGGIHANRQR